jgi:hypothetical protein
MRSMPHIAVPIPALLSALAWIAVNVALDNIDYYLVVSKAYMQPCVM